jgi:hypothetical protein
MRRIAAAALMAACVLNSGATFAEKGESVLDQSKAYTDAKVAAEAQARVWADQVEANSRESAVYQEASQRHDADTALTNRINTLMARSMAVHLPGVAFVSTPPARYDDALGCAAPPGGSLLSASVQLPVRAKIIGLSVDIMNASGSDRAELRMRAGQDGRRLAVINATGTGGPSPIPTFTTTLAEPETVDDGEYVWVTFERPNLPDYEATQICGVTITFYPE